MGKKRICWRQSLTDILMLLLSKDDPSDLPLYVGAGCCSSLNSDRRKIVIALNDAREHNVSAT